MTRRTVSLAQRFWVKVEKTESCWNWTGGKISTGYGSIGLGAPSRKTALAHRISYELCIGPIPEGLVIDHTCGNRGCVNPGHLQAVTQKQNTENRHKTSSSTGSLGVYHSTSAPGKFEARVKHCGKVHYAGLHATFEEAQRAVVAKRNQLFSNNLNDRNAA